MYVYGTSGPNTFDNPGLVYWAHKQAGINIPRTVAKMIASKEKRIIPPDQILAGDVFVKNPKTDPIVSIVYDQLGDDGRIKRIGIDGFDEKVKEAFLIYSKESLFLRFW